MQRRACIVIFDIVAAHAYDMSRRQESHASAATEIRVAMVSTVRIGSQASLGDMVTYPSILLPPCLKLLPRASSRPPPFFPTARAVRRRRGVGSGVCAAPAFVTGAAPQVRYRFESQAASGARSGAVEALPALPAFACTSAPCCVRGRLKVRVKR